MAMPARWVRGPKALEKSFLLVPAMTPDAADPVPNSFLD